MKIIIETISTTRKKTEALLKEQKGRGCNLQGIWLYKEDLKGVDLRGANLQGADLRDADFRGAKLHGAVIDERVAQHIEALQMIEFEEARILYGLEGQNLRNYLRELDLRPWTNPQVRGFSLKSETPQSLKSLSTRITDDTLRNPE